MSCLKVLEYVGSQYYALIAAKRNVIFAAADHSQLEIVGISRPKCETRCVATLSFGRK